MFPGHWVIRRESLFFASDSDDDDVNSRDDDVIADDSCADSISVVTNGLTSSVDVACDDVSDGDFDGFVEDEGDFYEVDDDLFLPLINERPLVCPGCVSRPLRLV